MFKMERNLKPFFIAIDSISHEGPLTLESRPFGLQCGQLLTHGPLFLFGRLIDRAQFKLQRTHQL